MTPAPQKEYIITEKQLEHLSEIDYGNCYIANRIVTRCHSRPYTSASSDKVLEEIVDLIDGRYEGMKAFYETPSDKRTGTDREAQLMFEEVKIIKDCVDIILDRQQTKEQMRTKEREQG